jgi:hypothetical protein
MCCVHTWLQEIEKAMQLIKGGFSYRLRKDFGYLGEVWQRGFSETRVEDHCFQYLAEQKATAAKAGNSRQRDGTA